MLCHANICTIEIKLQRHDRRIVGGERGKDASDHYTLCTQLKHL